MQFGHAVVFLFSELSPLHRRCAKRCMKTDSRLQEASSMSGDSLSYSDLLQLGDERLMQEVCAGNGDAFAVVFKRYHRLVHTVALRILRDAAEAEDVTQT